MFIRFVNRCDHVLCDHNRQQVDFRHPDRLVFNHFGSRVFNRLALFSV